MNYVDADGNEVELPKLTPQLAARMHAGADQPSAMGKWQAEYAFLQLALPTDYLAERVGGTKFDDIDLSALDVLFIDVCDTYNRPAAEAQAKSMRAQLDGMDMDKLTRISEAMAAVSQPRSRQGFRVVK